MQPSLAGAPADLAAERERVLSMLESERINADEAAELLNALGETVPQKATRLSARRKLLLIGGGLTFLAFPLPWLSINLGAEMNRLTEIMPQMRVENGLGGMEVSKSLQVTPPSFQNGGTVRVSGSDMPHGLGWTVLLLVVLAAIVPLAAGHVDKRTVNTLTILAALAAGLVAAYLLLDNLRYASVGIVLALAGCGLALAGAAMERKVMS